jgi:multisubunit Na+/H+ antiporter MnhB subunit
MADTVSSWLLDGLLVVTLLLLAWRALASTNLFTAIVVFIGFGLVMALAWVRLRAPDVALAEAAIGAGLTGALLLNAYAKQRDTKQEKLLPKDSHPLHHRPRQHIVQYILLVTGLAFAIPLSWAVLSLTPLGPGLRPAAEQYLALSGVTNPVTAVLLNYRGYDTLLEIAVLLLAMLAVWVINESQQKLPQPSHSESDALWGLTATLVPLLIVTAGYVLWIGAIRPGGAFQGGALLGGAAVLLVLGGHSIAHVKPLWIRLVTSLGLLVFIITGALLIYGGNFLQYPVKWAGALILFIETAAMVSIGAILAALFLGYKPGHDRNRPMYTDKDMS